MKKTLTDEEAIRLAAQLQRENDNWNKMLAGGFRRKAIKWRGLYDDLIKQKYIDTTLEVFNEVMEYRQLPGDASKIQWLTPQADALYFQDAFSFTMPQFNKCFQSKDGHQFKEGARATTARKQILIDIVERYRR